METYHKDDISSNRNLKLPFEGMILMKLGDKIPKTMSQCKRREQLEGQVPILQCTVSYATTFQT